jgi:predicted GTPase
LRPDQLNTHHPGEAVLRMADIVIINKVDAAENGVIDAMSGAIARLLPDIPIIRAASPARLEQPDLVHGKSVLIVEDGPTITHGGMGFGAGFAALRDLPDIDIVDPRRSATPDIAAVYEKFPHIGPVLPAMGYGQEQRRSLAKTINASDAEIVVAATPADIALILPLEKPVVRVTYGYADTARPYLTDLVDGFLDQRGL